MYELENAIIKDHYENILKKIKGGFIFGIEVDLDNPLMVAVASYYVGHKEGSNSQIDFWYEIDRILDET